MSTVPRETDRYKRLPQWAQQEITRLEANAADARAQLAAVLGTSDAPSLVRLIDYGADVEYGVPDRLHIMFQMAPPITRPDGRTSIADTIEVRHDGDRLHVRSNGTAIAIHPSGANSVAVTLDPRDMAASRTRPGTFPTAPAGDDRS